MRILHTSDWHLGRTLHGVDLHAHHEAFLDHLVEVVRAEAVDAVLVAGDVYDRAVPPVASVELLSDALARLTSLTRVVLTPGNHDSAARLGFGAGLYRDRLAVRSRVPGIGTPVLLPEDDGGPGALVYALPYLDPDMCRDALTETDPGGEPVRPARSHEAVTGAALRRVRRDLAARRRSGGTRQPAVVMAHAFVVGGQPSESERDIRVGGVDSVPAGVFADVPGAGELSALDYVALGHLHGPQRVGTADLAGPQMRYAGSPLAYSFSERHHHKSTAVIELSEDGVRSVRLVEAPTPRRLSEVAGTLAELLGPVTEDRTEDWVRVAVTDDVRPSEMYAQVRRRFPHALVVQHRPARGTERTDALTVHAAQDPVTVAEEFVRTAGGRPPEAAERTVLRQAYERVLSTGRSA
ncbi:exonuclease SbcCD subunit D C-terminal domain-containing protein [Georgenia sp. 10Sc9-8]|uniref:Nuclease SbcCD subunit D n=1 Tax=Georgenia halotolerans TaxID=3028317 RepID=A0ABT5U0J7_9MICO|nr:exonuclease SbcCD subunit D C-terminal domain-containing protein [Georgenia halotolerans]